MTIEETRAKHTKLSFYRNKVVRAKSEYKRKTKPETIEQEIKKADKLIHFSRRIKVLEIAIAWYKEKYRE